MSKDQPNPKSKNAGEIAEKLLSKNSELYEKPNDDDDKTWVIPREQLKKMLVDAIELEAIELKRVNSEEEKQLKVEGQAKSKDGVVHGNVVLWFRFEKNKKKNEVW